LTTKRAVAFGLILLMTLPIALASCNINKPKEIDDMVAIVNGEEIAKEKFDLYYEQMKANYAMMGLNMEDADEEMVEMLQQQVLNDMINTTIILQQAKKDNITIDDETIAAEIDSIKESFTNEEEFEQALTAANITLDDLKNDITNSLLLNKYLEANIDQESITVTDEELQQLYELYYGEAEDAPDFEEVKAGLKLQVMQEKSNQLLSALIEELRADSEIEILL
jgi:peptidyl-prolyl cis-trans isomerase SurA